MLENGFIKLHRKILKWEWYDDRNTTALFIHLLLTVNAADEIWHGVKIQRGSRVSSFAKLAKELNLTIKEIRTCLQHLERTGEVAHASTRNFTVFTVLNYDSYQARGTAKGTQNGTPAGKRGANEGQQRKKEKESQEDKERLAAPLAGSTPAPSGAGSHAAGGKSIYERMRE